MKATVLSLVTRVIVSYLPYKLRKEIVMLRGHSYAKYGVVEVITPRYPLH